MTRADPSPPSRITIPLTQPFWDAVEDGRLLVQRCRVCARHQLYPGPRCRGCWSDELDWVPASGEATVWTFTIAHVPGHPYWVDKVPYVIAVVELAEGPRMTTNIVGCEPHAVRVGQPVTVAFESAGPGHPIVQFRPT